jgi:hypothetical protein
LGRRFGNGRRNDDGDWGEFKVELKGSFGQVDEDGIAGGFGLVVGSEFLAQTADLEANDGIVLGVVGGGFAESFETNSVLFQAIGFAIDRFFGEILKQLPMNFGSLEGLTLNETIDLSVNLFLANYHF